MYVDVGNTDAIGFADVCADGGGGGGYGGGGGGYGGGGGGCMSLS